MANVINVKNVVSSHFQDYMKKIFMNMFLAVGVSALVIYMTLYMGGLNLLLSVNDSGMVGLTPLFWVASFGGLAVALYAQVRAFSIKPSTAKLLLYIYAASIGLVSAPIIGIALNTNPAVVLQAFVIAALMFGCMALFGYKTQKDLSFMGIFLFLGMIGLFIAGIVSIFWPVNAFIVSIIGVIIFALFTAYDMQFLKKAYDQLGLEKNDLTREQMAVSGALHLYISFVAMFRYILNILMANRN